MTVDIRKPTSQDALSLQELTLYHAITEYRAGLGLAAVPLSRALTTTAGRHVADMRENIWAEGDELPAGANLHSWSDAPYLEDGGAPEVMWEAPARVGTGYPAPGYEISAAGYPDVAAALDAWTRSASHNAVLAQLGPWAGMEFLAIGVGVDTSAGEGMYAGRIFHVWFGEAADAEAPEIRGTADDDVVEGTRFDDEIHALGGADSVRGGRGGDALAGGDGDDALWGEAGYDLLYGGDGEDRVAGGGGDDRIFGGAHADRALGEAGDDTLAGGGGADALLGGDGDDRLSGDDGDDAASGADGADRMLGGEGEDTLAGGGGADWVYGGDGADRLLGGDDEDNVFGDAGDDRLIGDAAADRLSGEAGHDVLYGETGEDRLFGDAGEDALFGGEGDDRLAGDAGDDRLAGDEGDDVLKGDEGDDRLFGGAGEDALLGGDAADLLAGGDGDDRLFGGDARDLLAGGAGVDALTGGIAADVFIWTSLDDFDAQRGLDEIRDFEAGTDRIDLSGLASASADGARGAAPFRIAFVGGDAFGRSAGEVRQEDDLLEGDLDGDGAADFQLRVRAMDPAPSRNGDEAPPAAPVLEGSGFIF